MSCPWLLAIGLENVHIEPLPRWDNQAGFTTVRPEHECFNEKFCDDEIFDTFYPNTRCANDLIENDVLRRCIVGKD